MEKSETEAHTEPLGVNVELDTGRLEPDTGQLSRNTGQVYPDTGQLRPNTGQTTRFANFSHLSSG